jgi:autotransporter translocation and assembly factor TamB
MDPALELAGLADVRLAVHGRSGDPHWRFEGRVHAPTLGGHVADSLAIALQGGAHRLELEDGLFRLGKGTLRASLLMDQARAAFPDSLSPTALVRWLRDAGTWRGRMTADAFPLGRFTGVLPSASGWDGDLFGTLSLAGRPSAPEVEVQSQVERFGWRDIRTDDLTLRARYANERLDLQDVRAKMRGVESRATLSVPIRLAFGEQPVELDQPLRGRVDIPAGDLKVLPMMVPQLQYARGRFELAAEISGTARAPRLAGTGRIRDGVVRPINRGEVVEGIYAEPALRSGLDHPRHALGPAGSDRSPVVTRRGATRGRAAEELPLRSRDAGFRRVGDGPLRRALRR